MKCAIIGGSVLIRKLSSAEYQDINKLASYLVEKKIHVYTGGCDGFPYVVGKKCIEYGGTVLGFSPAISESEHVNIYHHPLDGCSKFVFMDSSSNNVNLAFLLRSLPLIEEADVVLALEGNWGTLFEVVTAVISGKKIILWKGFGGVSDDFEILYNKLSKECKYEYGEQVCYANDLDEVFDYLSECLRN